MKPISTKLGRKRFWGMGTQICSNKGAGPFQGPVRGKKTKKKLVNFKILLPVNHCLECI